MRFFSRVLAGFLLIVLLAFSLMRLSEAEQSRAGAREKLAVLVSSERALSEENARLRRYGEQERESALRHTARDELGLVDSDEIIFVFLSSGK